MIKIMGIDPGINWLGAAALNVNTKQQEPFKLIFVDSYRGDLTQFDIREDTPHQTKAKGLLRSYEYLLDHIEPDLISCEDNFLELSPSSFKRLIEVVTMMSFCTIKKRPEVPFHLALPRLAKQIVQVDFRGSTKEDVKEGLKKCPFLDLNNFNLDSLTEHANDAILLALYEAVQLYKSYGWDVNGRSNDTNGK